MRQSLIEAVGADAVSDVSDAWHDIAGYEIGRPSFVVTPGDTAAVQRLVRWARAHGVGLVPFGTRTACWRPLGVDGCVAVSLERIAHVVVAGDVVRIGAGCAVRPADQALRQRGLCLPLRPDNYGDSPVGAMIATATAAGVGMGDGPISRSIASLEVVLGTGAVLNTGASGALGHAPPFLADGAPDLTGLFLGSEGAFGIVTEVVLRAAPAPWVVHLHAVLPDPIAVLPIARRLGHARLFETWRMRTGEQGWDLDVWVASPLGSNEAAARAEVAAKMLGVPCERRSEDDARKGVEPAYSRRWEGPMGVVWDHFGARSLVAIEVTAPYDELPSVLGQAIALRAEHLAAGLPYVMVHAYLAPDYGCVGVFAETARGEEQAARQRTEVLREKWRSARVVPYRFGRTWPSVPDETTRALWRAFKAAVDPDGILHPGHPLGRLTAGG